MHSDSQTVRFNGNVFQMDNYQPPKKSDAALLSCNEVSHDNKIRIRKGAAGMGREVCGFFATHNSSPEDSLGSPLISHLENI